MNDPFVWFLLGSLLTSVLWVLVIVVRTRSA